MVRGALVTGPNPKSDLLGFAVDSKRKRLYLDLNRNLDLTDDPKGVHYSGFFTNWKRYSDIDIYVQRGEMHIPYRIDLWINRFSSVKSGWSGTIDRGETIWILDVVDNLDGVLDRKDILAIDFGNRFPWNPNLFLDGEAFDLAYLFENRDGTGVLVIEARPIHPPMGRLKIEGAGIEQLVLTGYFNAIINQPQKEIMVPAGRYTRKIVYIGSDEESERGFSGRIKYSLEIVEGETTVMKAGKPLRNSVEWTRRGSMIDLKYALVGVGGEKYSESFGNRDYRFKIYHGNQVVHSGKFDYG